MELLPHVIIFGLLLFILIISWVPKAYFFSWHPTLMGVGFLGLYCESILLFHPRFSPVQDHKMKVRLHQILQIMGLLLGSIGMWVIYTVKENASKPHIATFHALFGLLAFILGCVQSIGGIPLIYPQVRSLLKIARPLKDLKRKHAQMGTVTLVCALTAVALSFYSTWFEKKEFHRIYQHVTFGAVTTIMGVIVGQIFQGRLAQ